jgi:hypothetical protein
MIIVSMQRQNISTYQTAIIFIRRNGTEINAIERNEKNTEARRSLPHNQGVSRVRQAIGFSALIGSFDSVYI